MCSLFGLTDYEGTLTRKQKNRIISVLSKECEVRGTDASGIAYNYGGSLRIYKRPLPAHKLRFCIPEEATVVMGHTRMTTQGSEKKNYNNHPFKGRCGNAGFALAHNGVLYNDAALRKQFSLPATNIETDSYVAVQLLERQNALDLLSLKDMAEQLEGSFCFTLLDGENSLYFVKGDSPMVIYRFEGFYLYASTEEILRSALQRLNIKQAYTNVPIACGEILKLDRYGNEERASFDTARLQSRYFRWWDDWEGFAKAPPSHRTWVEELMDFAKTMGVPQEAVSLLLECGYDEEEVEELLYDPLELHACLSELCKEEIGQLGGY